MVVTDPDGNANEVQLRKARKAAPAPTDFWGFEQPRTTDNSASGGTGGGGGGGRRARGGGGGGG
ncbi:MAG TPA: hypothetical protein DCL72_07295, partial [Rhizobiales bacterium]|nr:hypothetical protein [Hyphomicrobiales bacterium]